MWYLNTLNGLVCIGTVEEGKGGREGTRGNEKSVTSTGET